jgi:3-dehydroquinate dehydratase
MSLKRWLYSGDLQKVAVTDKSLSDLLKLIDEVKKFRESVFRTT